MPDVNTATVYEDFGYWEPNDGRRLRVQRLAPHDEVDFEIHMKDEYAGVTLTIAEARDLAAALIVLCNIEGTPE
jgi:hypothetical protein